MPVMGWPQVYSIYAHLKHWTATTVKPHWQIKWMTLITTTVQCSSRSWHDVQIHGFWSGEFGAQVDAALRQHHTWSWWGNQWYLEGVGELFCKGVKVDALCQVATWIEGSRVFQRDDQCTDSCQWCLCCNWWECAWLNLISHSVHSSGSRTAFTTLY